MYYQIADSNERKYMLLSRKTTGSAAKHSSKHGSLYGSLYNS